MKRFLKHCVNSIDLYLKGIDGVMNFYRRDMKTKILFTAAVLFYVVACVMKDSNVYYSKLPVYLICAVLAVSLFVFSTKYAFREHPFIQKLTTKNIKLF